MSKIYIVGPVGSGKSTLARKISLELNIPCYELDNVVWKKNETGPDTRRSESEITQIFDRIISNNDWIIENVGKDIFDKGYVTADVIIYLKFKKSTLYYRVIKRWIKQNIGFESSAYNSDLKMLHQMLKWVDTGIKDSVLINISKYMDKTIILTERTINKYQNQDIYKRLVLKNY